MRILNFASATICLVMALAVVSCTDSKDEQLLNPDDVGSKSQIDDKAYDSRFPFPVWTDEQGLMHFDVNLADGPFLEKEKVIGALVGHGWKLNKCYDYEAYTVDSGNVEYQLDVVPGLIVGLVGVGNVSFVFNDGQTADVYCSWHDDTCPKVHNAKERHEYSYDSVSGVLDCFVWSDYKVVCVGDDDLWLGRRSAYQGCELNRQFLHYVRATPEEIAEWDKTHDE